MLESMSHPQSDPDNQLSSQQDSHPTRHEDDDDAALENKEGEQDKTSSALSTAENLTRLTAADDGNGESGESQRSAPESQGVAASSDGPAGTQDTSPNQLNSSQDVAASFDSGKPSSSAPGYIANRRSASFLKSMDFESDLDLPSSSAPALSARRLNRSSSYLRLSMTDDGHAQVIDRAAKSPSPKKTGGVASAAAGLRRSHSVAGLDDKFRQAMENKPARKVPRTSAFPGRSRDSRAWEFWCDTDARTSLASKADSAISGSAADAIGQIVASNKALRANTSRRNVPMTSGRGLNASGKPARPELQRASTTLGLSRAKSSTSPAKVSANKSKGGDYEQWEEDVATESDKENWEPEDRPQPQPLGRRRVHAARRVLGESAQAMSENTSLGSMMAREKRSKKGAAVEVLDEEVSKFMGHSHTESNGTNASSGEDFECVQSLLSLSQGNWR